MRLPTPRALLRFTAYFVPMALLGLAWWVAHTFGDVSFDQVIWHLQYADGAAIMLSEVFFVEFAVEVLLVPAVLADVAAIVHTAVAQRWSRGWPRIALRGVAPIATVAALAVFAVRLSLPSYAADYAGEDTFAVNYVDPAKVRISQGTLRNLVLIYAESVESGYGDAGLFGRDLLRDVVALPGHSFAHYRPVPGANWTIAAIVATQCGVPLKVYAQADVRPRHDGKSFLAGATCLGDILQAHGFRNVYLGGAPLSFAGKGRFLKDHGYQETWGREEWAATGATVDDLNAWGLYDATLFQRARGTLEKLHAAGEPFNLTLLTLDTHQPHGFLSPACRRRGANDFAGIVSCTSREIAEFVQFAQDRGYLRDTTVVVIGDHLAYPNPVYAALEQDPKRGMFNRFIGKVPPPNTTEVMPYDLFPTLLEVAGLHVGGDRMGLGYSAVGAPVVARPPERPQSWYVAAMRPSPTYDALWRPHAGPAPAPLAAPQD